MQLTTFLSAAATVATASALSAVQLNKQCDLSKPYARVINRCNYPVNVWSVVKGSIGCPTESMVTLKKGEIYSENYQTPSPDQGVSIKISKTKECTNNNIVQLEYFLEQRPDKKAYEGNYLDVSYVDCTGGDCPTKKEGYYLNAGSSTARAAKVAADGSWCPILSCSDAASCAKMSYILPDDVQTKTCDLDSSMDFYMCGSQAPSGDDDTPASSAPAPASSSKKAESPSPKPSTTLKAVVSSAANYKVNVAAVTNAPEIKEAAKVKTKVVYVTAYEYVNAKRHEHAHARRHQPFNA